MPNYSPTIRPPRLVSFVVKVVNVRFNTTAPMQYQAWSTHTCVWCVDTNDLLQTTQYKITNAHALENILSWQSEKEQRWIEYSEQVSWKWKFNHPLQVFCRRDKTHSYDMMMMIYLLTAIGLSPSGRSTVHIYTQTIHRTIQNKQYIEQHNNFGRVWAVPCLG